MNNSEPEIDYKAKYLRHLKLLKARGKKYKKTAKGIKTYQKAGFRQNLRKYKKKAIDYLQEQELPDEQKKLRLNLIEKLYEKRLNHINTTGTRPASYSFLHLTV